MKGNCVIFGEYCQKSERSDIVFSENTISVGLGILTEILIELGKKGYGVIKEKCHEDEEKKKIEKIFGKHLTDEFNDILSSTAFEKFSKAYYIRDYISVFFDYLMFGEASKSYRRILKSQPVSLADLQDYLAKQLLHFYDLSSLVLPDAVKVNSFMRAIVEAIVDYAESLLGPDSKAAIAFINENINRNTLALLRRFEWIEQRLTRYGQEVGIGVSDNYGDYVEEYMGKLQRMYSQAHVYLMDKFDLDDFYVSQNLAYINRELKKQYKVYHTIDEMPEQYWSEIGGINWKHIFDFNNIIYIIGGAGYGKSLFLRALVKKYMEMSFIDSEHYLLIYAELRDCYANSRGEQKSVLEMLQDSMVKNTGIDKDYLPKAMISEYLEAGRCIILFDALDEVPKEYRNDLHARLMTFFADKNANNKICITSRSRGFIPDRNAHILMLLPLNRKQIEEYVDNMIRLGRFDEDNKIDFLQQANRLLNTRFLNSFLILSLLVSIYKAEQNLPDTKLDLYQKCFEYIARKRELEKGGDFDWELIRSLLMDNAFIELSCLCAPNNKGATKVDICDRLLEVYEDEYFDRNQARNAIDEFLRFCSERTEVFVPDANEDMFKFFHRSFYEYFYSKYIVIRLPDAVAIYDELIATDMDSEVFELVIAMLKATNVQRFKEVITLLCDNMERKLSSGDEECKELHILSVIMGSITNRRMIERFVKMLCDYAPTIVKMHSKHYVHNMLAELVERESEYVQKISRVYADYAYDEILERTRNVVFLSNSLNKANKYLAKIEPMPLDTLYYSFITPLSFYSQIVLWHEHSGPIETLNYMKNFWLKKRFRTSKTGRKNYKLADGQVSQLLVLLQEYENPKKQQ